MKSMVQIRTREDWLVAASNLVRPFFLDNGIVLPNSFRMACGWPLGRRRGGQGRSHAIGQCWARKASSDGCSEIFVSPELDDAIEVAEVLVHELIHAADDCRNGQRGPFERWPLPLAFAGRCERRMLAQS